uniref:Putative secreted protein n=1 Tax=Anopheles darlingi TaxID=43151 RepID=A0A2M4DSP6_ANODA
MRPHFRFWGVSLYLSFFTARALNSRRHSRHLAFPRLSTCTLRKTIQPTPPRSIYRYLCQQEKEEEGVGSDGGCETTPLSRDNTTRLEAAHGMCTPSPLVLRRSNSAARWNIRRKVAAALSPPLLTSQSEAGEPYTKDSTRRSPGPRVFVTCVFICFG